MDKQDPPEPDETILVPVSEDYYVEENDENTDEAGMSAEGATPFQFSLDMPVIEIEDERQPRHSTLPELPKNRRSRLRKLALLGTVLIVASGFLWLTVFAQPAQPFTGVASTTQPHHSQQAPIPTLTPTVGSLGTWMPEPLPAGWTTAGLTMGDGIFALRTAWAFTDREEGIDYRAVGTR